MHEDSSEGCKGHPRKKPLEPRKLSSFRATFVPGGGLQQEVRCLGGALNPFKPEPVPGSGFRVYPLNLIHPEP